MATSIPQANTLLNAPKHERLRILQVGKYYHPYRGGIESQLRVLSKLLSQVHDVDIVVANTAPKTQVDVIEGISVTRCGRFLEIASTALAPSMVWELARRAFDVIHLHLPDPMAIAAYFAGVGGRPHVLVVSYHSEVVRQRFLARPYRAMEQFVLRRARRVVVASPHLARVPALREHSARVIQVPFGVDLQRFLRPSQERIDAWRRRLGVPLVLAVGRLVYYKGFEVLVNSMTAIPAHLAIVGAGPLLEPLRIQIARLGLEGRCHLLGDVSDEDLAALFGAATVFCMPSTAKSEAFGIAQVEAMASGLAVVNTRLDTGVNFVSPHGETGLTVAPGDGIALTDALRTLLQDEQLRDVFGKAGRARANTVFSGEAMLTAMLRVYEEALSGPA